MKGFLVSKDRECSASPLQPDVASLLHDVADNVSCDSKLTARHYSHHTHAWYVYEVHLDLEGGIGDFHSDLNLFRQLFSRFCKKYPIRGGCKAEEVGNEDR